MADIHLNDIGTIFRVSVVDESDASIDVSGALTKSIVFRKPDGTTVTQTADFYIDGTDGIIQYTSIADDLDQTGTWQLQAFVELPGGAWSSEVQAFKVRGNL